MVPTYSSAPYDHLQGYKEGDAQTGAYRQRSAHTQKRHSYDISESSCLNTFEFTEEILKRRGQVLFFMAG